ncbi:MAG: hypothetical protein ACFFFH_15435 [Candidatus Thorarchaeota archaeon]
MLTREELEQLTEEELEALYQQKKGEYDQKVAKNRRIRGLLSRKVDERQNSVKNLKKKIDDLLVSHPEFSVVKQDFGDITYDPEELKKTIQDKQKILSQLQSKKLQLKKDIPPIVNHIEQQKSVEEQFQNEINLLISQSETLSNSESSELLELDQLSKDIQSAQEELDTLNIEIEELRKEVHQQG